jgi:6-pyruvoyltetrahydropterin/6-carboxytetrahydropterin synthase
MLADFAIASHPWLIYKEVRFEAAHRLPYHDGKCQRLHGHSWIGRVYVTADPLVRVILIFTAP